MDTAFAKPKQARLSILTYSTINQIKIVTIYLKFKLIL